MINDLVFFSIFKFYSYLSHIQNVSICNMLITLWKVLTSTKGIIKSIYLFDKIRKYFVGIDFKRFVQLAMRKYIVVIIGIIALIAS
jgi:hypothetical protein